MDKNKDKKCPMCGGTGFVYFGEMRNGLRNIKACPVCIGKISTKGGA